MFPVRSQLMTFIVLCGLFVVAQPSLAMAESKASGRITINGKPVADGRVTFHLPNGQFAGSKIVEGKFAVDQMPVGTLKVTVEGTGVPAKYTSEETSALTVQTKVGTAIFDFNLN